MADYLIHYNKNHSKANGQFVSGDGDGDGIANDHANQKKKLLTWKYSTSTKEHAENTKNVGKRQISSGVALAAAGSATAFLGKVMTMKADSDFMYYAGTGAEFVGAFVAGSGVGRTVGGIINTTRANNALKNY
jgi:hypothetical protein